MTTKKPSKAQYENNPFFVAVNGITLLFNGALGVAIVMIITSLVSMFGGGGGETSGDTKRDFEKLVDTLAGWSSQEWMFAVGATFFIGLAILMISALFGGVSSYASAELAKGKEVALGNAFRVSFDNLWAYMWLQIIMFVKVLLWSLLLILPGIYFAFRYSLAGVAFYDSKKNLRGDAAIQESLRLTKNGWLTTFASHVLFNLITFFVLKSVIATAVNTTLYKQFSSAGDKKPQAHWLSWLTLLFPLAFVAFAFVFAILVAAGAALGGLIIG